MREGKIRFSIAKRAAIAALLFHTTGVLADDANIGDANASALDSVQSIDSLSRAQLLRLPVRTVHEILALQPGVTSLRPRSGQNHYDLHTRGGRTHSTDYLFNSVSFRDPFSGEMTATFSPYAIQQVGFTPGYLPVYNSPAGSGIMTVEGFSGTEKYSGMIELLSDNVGGTGYDQNWYTAQLAGPVPMVDKAFFAGTLERRWLGDRDKSGFWCIFRSLLVETKSVPVIFAIQ